MTKVAGDRTRLTGLLRPGVLVLLGVAVAVGAAWWPRPAAYLAGVVVTAIGLILILIRLTAPMPERRRPRVRTGSAAAVLVLAAAAVLVPWWSAGRSSVPEHTWSAPVAGSVDDVLPVGDRVLLVDDTGLRSLDAATGQEQWSQRSGPVFFAGEDGHVLTVGASGPRWLSPAGEVSWSPDQGELAGLERAPAFTAGDPGPLPVAAADGVLVVRTCADAPAEHSEVRCTYQGVGPRGEVAYELQGTDPSNFLRGQDARAAGGRMPASAVLPSVFLVPDGDRMQIVQAGTGERTASVDNLSGHFAVVTSDTVVHQTEVVGEDRCETLGTGPDGSTRWRAELPCFYDFRPGTLTADRLYLPRYADSESGAASGTLAVNVATGASHAFGAEHTWPDGRPPITLGPDVVLAIDGAVITGMSPETGEERWTVPVPGENGEADLGRGLALTSTVARHNPFAPEEMTAVSIIDPGTGEYVVSMRVDPAAPMQVLPLSPQAALMRIDDMLYRVGR